MSNLTKFVYDMAVLTVILILRSKVVFVLHLCCSTSVLISVNYCIQKRSSYPQAPFSLHLENNKATEITMTITHLIFRRHPLHGVDDLGLCAEGDNAEIIFILHTLNKQLSEDLDLVQLADILVRTVRFLHAVTDVNDAHESHGDDTWCLSDSGAIAPYRRLHRLQLQDYVNLETSWHHRYTHVCLCLYGCGRGGGIGHCQEIDLLVLKTDSYYSIEEIMQYVASGT